MKLLAIGPGGLGAGSLGCFSGGGVCLPRIGSLEELLMGQAPINPPKALILLNASDSDGSALVLPFCRAAKQEDRERGKEGKQKAEINSFVWGSAVLQAKIKLLSRRGSDGPSWPPLQSLHDDLLRQVLCKQFSSCHGQDGACGGRKRGESSSPCH